MAERREREFQRITVKKYEYNKVHVSEYLTAQRVNIGERGRARFFSLRWVVNLLESDFHYDLWLEIAPQCKVYRGNVSRNNIKKLPKVDH